MKQKNLIKKKLNLGFENVILFIYKILNILIISIINKEIKITYINCGEIFK